MDECKDPNSRMLFNSLGGFSSVNHLHFHLLNMTGISPDNHTPIERAALLTPTLSSNRRPGVVLHLIDTSAAGWGCAAFVLESSPTSPIDAITAAVDDIVLALYASGIPFHLLFVTSRKIYVIPRQNQAVQERTAGLRQAAFEVVGVQVCLGPHQWENTTWSEFMERLRSTVSLEPSLLQVVAQRAGWTSEMVSRAPTADLASLIALAVGAAILGFIVQRTLPSSQ